MSASVLVTLVTGKGNTLFSVPTSFCRASEGRTDAASVRLGPSCARANAKPVDFCRHLVGKNSEKCLSLR